MSSTAAILAREVLAKRRPLRKRLPSTELPRVIDRAYLREMLVLLRKAKDLVDVELVPQLEAILRDINPHTTTDSLVTDSERLEYTIERIKMSFGRAVSAEDFAAIVRRAGWRTVDVNRLKTKAQLKVLFGVDVIANEPGLEQALRVFTRENVGLIKSVSDRYFTEIESSVIRNARAGIRADLLARDVGERFGVAQSRAALIARDQTNKLSGDLTKTRQTALGISEYIWRTAKDDLVRPGHAVLEGQVCSWKDPPIVDAKSGRRAHPGGDIQCRCTAEPVLPGVNEPRPRNVAVKERASSSRFLPAGVPSWYAKHLVAPAGRFSEDRILAAFPSGFSETSRRLSAGQQVVVRRELNNLMSAEGMIERTLVAQGAAKEIEAIIAETKTTKDPIRQAVLAAKQRDLEQMLLSRGQSIEGLGRLDGSAAAKISVSSSETQALAYAATHSSVSGKITVSPRHFKGFVDFFRTAPEKRTAGMVDGLHTMIHETVHGHSPMVPHVYQGVGAKLEEATTEMAAQFLAEKVATGWTYTYSADTAGQVIRGAYSLWVGATIRAVSETFDVPIQKAKDLARAASIAMRRGSDLIRTIDAYAHHYARQFPQLRRKVAAAERTAELDFKVKLERTRRGELALLRRMTGIEIRDVRELDDPGIQRMIKAELADRQERAGMQVTEAFRKRLLGDLAQASDR